ncbi:substrate-binding domain-containing protein [Microtetraspora sp. AC03309]|uniref:substrate-binding domain-containing protein n=1 Tax=Microtetraspora sp. AC03309 TaxID=2779376 RepID=UPI001E2DE44A|nr:substrate-binding domain-containing protein [Microtetraspora sp. AC03309]MCC5574025.1 substrate-binding domain-containing protein [Microtetraspora sp. AC03309]
MGRKRHQVRLPAVLTAATALLLAAACGSPGTAESGSGGTGSTEPIKVGLVYSKSGPLASYGKQYMEGFQAGLDYATNGSKKIGDRAVEVTEVDDAGDPAKAVSAAKDLIGKGYKILAGSTSSGVATQVAPIAEQNKVLFISGPAATDAVTGAGTYTFRSGRQTSQDINTAAAFIGDVQGKKVLVFAQDSAFGQANVAGVQAVLGAKGAKVEPLLVPASATDFTPFATQAKEAKGDLLFVAWAGTTAQAMWTALGQQGVFEATTVVTGLDITATWPAYGPVADKVNFLSHYFAGAAGTEQEKAMTERVTKAGGTVDLFTGDGFTAAQMIVHAAEKGGDPDAMVQSLSGWSFDGVKGKMTVRAEDHALLQPMFQAKLTGGATPTAELVKKLEADAVAPAVATK